MVKRVKVTPEHWERLTRAGVLDATETMWWPSEAARDGGAAGLPERPIERLSFEKVVLHAKSSGAISDVDGLRMREVHILPPRTTGIALDRVTALEIARCHFA